jgi:hypothetical protein
MPESKITIVWLIRISIVIKQPCSGSKRGLLQFYTNTVEKGATLWQFGVPSAKKKSENPQQVVQINEGHMQAHRYHPFQEGVARLNARGDMLLFKTAADGESFCEEE